MLVTIAFVADPWEDGDEHIDVEAIRAQIRKLSDAELSRERPRRASIGSPVGRNRKAPRKVFVVGLEEWLAEWRRRQG